MPILRRGRTAYGLAIAFLAASAPQAAGQMSTVRVASGLQNPVYVTSPPGETDRLFIVEQRGVVRISKSGTLLAAPFLDWEAHVTAANELGMLGLAFDPDFDVNRLFYVYYTAGAVFDASSVVARFTVSATNADSADTSSFQRVIVVDQTAPNHNGGHIEFGSDGFLYWGLGDGGGAGDPNDAGQNGQTLLGKMLRIDPSADDFPGDDFKNYAIPPTNPFVGNAAFLDEIWALGLRNPYRWSFDRETRDMYIGDVGQGCREEIDFQPAASAGGENYGWRRREGTHCFDPSDPFDCNPPGPCGTGLVDPIYEYDHTTDDFSCSVTGGYVYRGSEIPKMRGHYFFADFCSDQIYTFRFDGGAVTELTNRTGELAPAGGLAISDIAAFGEDGAGELYVVDRKSAGGEVYKIVPDSAAVGVVPAASPGSHLDVGAPHPNPFSRGTRVPVRLKRAADLTASVYDAGGRLVRMLVRGAAPAGELVLVWDGASEDGAGLPAGVYFVRVRSEGAQVAQPVVLVR